MEQAERKVITRSPSHAVHAINAGGLLDSDVEAESRLEAHFIRRAALLPLTHEITHQPFRIPVSPRGYTPDFLVYFPKSGFKAVIEIKVAAAIKLAHLELFDRAASTIAERGFVFFVITETELSQDKIHRRAILLTRYAKEIVSSETITRITECLSNYPEGLAIGTLARKSAATRPQILGCVARGILSTGRRLQTDLSALVKLRNETEEFDDEIQFCRWFGAAPWGEDIRARPTT